MSQLRAAGRTHQRAGAREEKSRARAHTHTASNQHVLAPLRVLPSPACLPLCLIERSWLCSRRRWRSKSRSFASKSSHKDCRTHACGGMRILAKFLKSPFIVTFYSNCTRALTLQNFSPGWIASEGPGLGPSDKGEPGGCTGTWGPNQEPCGMACIPLSTLCHECILNDPAQVSLSRSLARSLASARARSLSPPPSALL